VLLALAAGLTAWFLWPFLAYGLRFPLGPDAPVYLWWTRLAGAEGLSAVGSRAAIPALTLVVQGSIGLSVVQATAAVEVALGVGVGLSSAALLRGRTTTVGWVLAGGLAGTFAVHLAAGYLANLLVAVAFLAAATALAQGTRRGAWIAAGCLAACAFSHPLFFVLGAAILALTAAMTWRSDRRDAMRIGGAVLGGGAIGAMGILSLVAGPPPADVDTSRDAFLRRAGLGAELRSAYFDRFVHRWARYVQWTSVPLAAIGFGRLEGFVGRFLRAWAVVTVAGVGVALATGWLPADRLTTFGFVVPILSAMGIVHVARWLGRRRSVAVLVGLLAAGAMLAGAFIAWDRQRPFLSVEEVRAATIANGVTAGLDEGVPLVFLVNEADETVSFLATRAGNVIRASVPPDRVRDVVIVVPSVPGVETTERLALERLTERDRREAEATAGRPARVFVLTPFDEIDDPEAPTMPPGAEAPLAPVDPLEPASPGAIVLSSLLVLALISAAGFGWARAIIPDAVTAAALAPAVGASALVVGAIALERLGVPIDVGGGAWFASALAGGGGYLVWGVLERRAPMRPAPQVQE
jgi:hypothetical protein